MTEAPRKFSAIAVYCGSNVGKGEVYQQAAQTLGTEIGRRGITLIYGGTHKGLMGILADAALAAGGTVHGVITKRLADKGHLHQGLTRSEVVEGMQNRKKRMIALADGFIALPGGIGTLEEVMEVWTLNQLGDLDKPAGFLDVSGYYQPFMGFIDHMIAEGFLPAAHRAGIVLDPSPAALIDQMEHFQKVTVPKWM